MEETLDIVLNFRCSNNFLELLKINILIYTISRIINVSISFDTIRYDTIRYDTIRYDTIRYDTIRYDTIRYDTIRYDTIRYDTIRYDTIRYDTIRYDTIRLFSKTQQYIHINMYNIIIQWKCPIMCCVCRGVT